MGITETTLYSEVLPNLFISGTLDDDTVYYGKNYVSMSKEPVFDSVVCLYGHANPVGYYVREQRFGIADSELEPSAIPEILELADWLHKEWKQGKKVAAKCQAGWNRSSLIVALVLLKEGYDAEAAIELIRAKRSPNALCNPHFVQFIKEIAA